MSKSYVTLVLVAAAVVAVMAAIATGGASVILAGALIGAAVGAGIATAAIAVSDYQSGNVRSLGDAAFGIAGGALFGGVAGAAIAAAPFAAEFYTPLINAQLAVWGMTGASVGTGLVTAGFVGITGVNAAFIANNIVAMNSGYDFLGSTIFRNHPDIYMGAQMVTALASMNILGTGLAVAATNQNTQTPDILSDKTLTRQTGKVDNYMSKVTGEAAARADFDAMKPINVETKPNGTIVGTLSDGRTINMHPSTTLNGKPTVEIYDSSTKTSIKIRY